MQMYKNSVPGKLIYCCSGSFHEINSQWIHIYLDFQTAIAGCVPDFVS